ncbi:phage holin [uncultured Robinsoniella sp.]|uniref:phage holin n=1 Tax=uncultured Robinsoniella sp. TaxID=904190 RepID=UPI00374EC15E
MKNNEVQKKEAVENSKEQGTKINFKVRLKNKAFWLALIPAVLLLVQVVAAVFGYTLDLGDLGNKLLAVVNAVFAVLTILGVVVDPTTQGVGDSSQALTYTEPK